jgi:hypothetical protein
MMNDQGHDHVFVELGHKGNLGEVRAFSIAHSVSKLIDSQPDAQFCFLVGGFDNDEREVWNIDEAKNFFALFAYALAELGKPFTDLNLHDDTKATLALCLGVGKITATHKGGYTVEVFPS